MPEEDPKKLQELKAKRDQEFKIKKEYGVELNEYLEKIETKVGKINNAADELKSAYRNLFATSDIDISEKDDPPKWIGRIEHAKMLRKKAEEILG